MQVTPIMLRPERRAELDDYAERHGQDLETALDDVLADYFAWERQDHEETVAALLEGNEDVRLDAPLLPQMFINRCASSIGFWIECISIPALSVYVRYFG